MRFTAIFTLFMASQALAVAVAPQAEAAVEAREPEVELEGRDIHCTKLGGRCYTNGKWGTCHKFHTGLSCRT